jgi:alpha-amylase/alpha-mannosidase (GH57 family)
VPDSQRYICIHGHFYQPPRENPWLEVIEQQDSAYPYHDWNERITAEAYGPNARSRILDDQGRIFDIANNYARMSFNVGPTLLKWLEDEAPDVYQAILDADKESIERFGGHGSAMAQVYNHMILPLANTRDKYTQILWGIRDFEHRFGRSPEGMWLPETAVDTESLDIMASLGIKFVILEPGQAERVRRDGEQEWTELNGERIDPTRAYYTSVPGGRRMNVFFYDGAISRAVAFEGLLSSGEQFANRLSTGFSEERDWPQLVNIATDGESYGHHHPYGDMALAFALEYIEQREVARLTNYSHYLANHPPEYQVEIRENTSWSCSHGIERWRSDCGCNTGANSGWNQAWRAPLRSSLDWLRDRVAALYEERGRDFFPDPWVARDEYITVILNRDEENIQAFLVRNANQEAMTDRVSAMKLLEMQRHALLMYASCGWFFDEVSGIETTQVLQYAGRAVQLAQQIFGDSIEDDFLELLSEAKSNIPENGNGRDVYEKFVRPAMVDLAKVGAHFAVSSLFGEDSHPSKIYSYEVDVRDYERRSEGAAQMLVGRTGVSAGITHQTRDVVFGVLHMGDHNITAGVRDFAGDEAYEQLKIEAFEAFSRADLPETIRVLDRHFGELTYSLRSLFKDEQRRILRKLLDGAVADAESSNRVFYDHHAPLMRFVADVGFPLPSSLQASAEVVVSANLRRELEGETINKERLQDALRDVSNWLIEIDESGLAYVAQKTLERLADQFAGDPNDITALRALEDSAAALGSLPFSVNLYTVQNTYWRALQEVYPAILAKARAGDDDAAGWVESFRRLGETLSVRVGAE